MGLFSKRKELIRIVENLFVLKSKIEFTSIDEYILVQPVKVRAALKILRQTIKKAAPDAEEVISYQMPAFKFHGVLVYFAAFKNHFSFFPTSSGVRMFKEKLKSFETSKGTIKFPLDKPIPVKLITEIVRFRVKENLEKNYWVGKADRIRWENFYLDISASFRSLHFFSNILLSLSILSSTKLERT